MEQLVEGVQIARITSGKPAEHDGSTWIEHGRSLAPVSRGVPRSVPDRRVSQRVRGRQESLGQGEASLRH
jgi:hypothetical protein